VGAGSLGFFLHSLKPGDRVYHIGTNAGVYAVLPAQVVGERGMVVAFEPHPGTREQLLQNIRLNGAQNVPASDKALGERAGEQRLYTGQAIANLRLLPGADVRDLAPFASGAPAMGGMKALQPLTCTTGVVTLA
jgi:predicted methyltransferase